MFFAYSGNPQRPQKQRPRGIGSDGFLGVERLLFYKWNRGSECQKCSFLKKNLIRPARVVNKNNRKFVLLQNLLA
jgi:hypothetical protein